jgi:aspartyl-tRNA(Asn)/glutamyl-tRNA(Gln) amidotransferase subunit A
MTSILFKTAQELAALIAKKEISPLELMEATLRRIEAVNPSLNAFCSVDPESALEEAKAMTEAIGQGEKPGPLAGVPMGVKDLEDVAGFVTSFGSVPFKDNMAAGDSVQVARLKAAGAVVVGKTNVPEFGFTGFTKNRLFGVTRNPWNLERTCGGSSGGSAAVVAAGLAPICTGSDAGGSIRIPACYCGCFGMKPSFGRIPTGPHPYLSYSHMTVMGPLTRSVADAALYLDCAAGYHPADPHSLPGPANSFLSRIDHLPDKLTIAFSPDLGYARVEKDVMTCARAAAAAFKEMGHRLEPWTEALPDTAEAWMPLICTDIYAQIRGLLKTHREVLGKTLVAMVEKTRSLTVADIDRFQRLRLELNRRLDTLFGRYDLLLSPTMPTEAFAANGPPPAVIDGEKVPLLGAVAFTYPFNLSGHPAATVPAGMTSNGLPAGLQIVGPRHRDDLVLQAARAYEKARPWDRLRPGL